MKNLLTIVKKDLKGYFDQPTGYILIVIFAAISSYLFFFVSGFNDTSEASVRELFNLLPWLLGIFIPASTMRLIAEEQRDGTLEILLTHPIKSWVVLFSKFIVGMLFVSIAILSTIGIPVALQTIEGINELKWNLDEGAVLSQYIGSFFLAGVFVSVGLWTSSLTQNQIISFVLGIFFTAILLLIGLDIVTDPIPDRFAGLLQDLSPITHFQSISRGILDFGDIIYFIALTSTFLSATFLSIRKKSLNSKSPNYRNLQLGVTGMIILSILTAWFSNSIGGRLDLTESRLYSMHPSTKTIISDLDDLLIINLFSSKDPPTEIITTTRDVRDFLNDLAQTSNSKVKIVHKFPEPPKEDDDNSRNQEAKDLREASMAGIPVQQFNVRSQGEILIKNGYLGISMTYGNKREIIPFIETIDGFEYRITSLIEKMTKSNMKTIGFLTGHGEKSINTDYQFLASLLNQQYNIINIDLEKTPADINNIDILIIPGPNTIIPDDTSKKINDFIVNGGKVMFFIDRIDINKEQLIAIPNRNSYHEFLSDYGVIIDDNILFDIISNENLSFIDQSGERILQPYPYWMRVSSIDTNITGKNQSVLIPWGSSVAFDLYKADKFNMIPLLQTTKYAAVDFNYQNNPDISPYAQALQIKETDMISNNVGIALTNKEKTQEFPNDFRIVVIGDSDWLSNETVQLANENLTVALNIIDWLAQEEALLQIRNKVILDRTLLFKDSTNRNLIQYSNIIGMPLIFIIIGFIRYIRRRSNILRSN
ncbi:MAG: hypothetical protein CL758_07985 [Chloroflexi bacterium]|nr:hypothetical protein [Chloroflexota bacterium]|tara:strand:- start:3669 stop:5960 length:2292 start_codon:yes stop_codon:yes gene_type:complete